MIYAYYKNHDVFELDFYANVPKVWESPIEMSISLPAVIKLQ